MVNLKSAVDEEYEFKYDTTFKDSTETELRYTNDSTIDITYMLYQGVTENIYAEDDRRVLVSTLQLPPGTKLTLVDYSLDGEDDRVYYYQVQDYGDCGEPEQYADGFYRYIYDLTKFIEMGSVGDNIKYKNDPERYYYTIDSQVSGSEKSNYMFEKYDLSINFESSGISEDQYGQEMYLELRSGNKTIDQKDDAIKYDLLINRNADIELKLPTSKDYYNFFDTTLEIPLDFTSIFKEQLYDESITVIDSKYRNMKLGISVEILSKKDDTEERLKETDIEIQALKVGNTAGSETIYTPTSEDCIVRFNIADGYSLINNKMTLQLRQNEVRTGEYTLRFNIFASYDGEYYGDTEIVVKNFVLRVVSKNVGFVVTTNKEGRIRYSETAEGLDDEGSDTMIYLIKLLDKVEGASARAVLFKRNETYALEDGEYKYQPISYTAIDLEDYIKNELILLNEEEKEYLIQQSLGIENPPFEAELKKGLETGEYRLEFRLYIGEDYTKQSISKTFVIINEEID